MLKKENRLLKRRDFEELRKTGKVVWGQMMGMSYVQNPSVSPEGETSPPPRRAGLEKGRNNKTRFGVIVSKKISNLAVERNKIRRQIYRGIKENMGNLENKGYRVIFLVKKNIVGVKNDVVEREIKILLNVIGKR